MLDDNDVEYEYRRGEGWVAYSKRARLVKKARQAAKAASFSLSWEDVIRRQIDAWRLY